ncbi:hypothetical protein ABHF33_13225 [Chitinibacter sp. FCG-7]|uniref:XRE family transcriptional regulator n=1 Tax=Chitinibacter mangrovi TaxID=3153927 RepID=A0AAU7F7A5_9NEIS
MDNTDLRERMILVINETVTSSRLRYIWLESHTGVAQEKWKKLCNRKQNPTSELIEALCNINPQFSEWIVCGRLSNELQLQPQDPLNAAIRLVWHEEQPVIAEKIKKLADSINAEQGLKYGD